jgi:hypothetical protein
MQILACCKCKLRDLINIFTWWRSVYLLSLWILWGFMIAFLYLHLSITRKLILYSVYYYDVWLHFIALPLYQNSVDLSRFKLLFGMLVVNYFIVLLIFFSCLCCPIMCLCVLISMLWCRYDFCNKTIFGSFLSPVVCMSVHVILRYLYLFVHSGVQHILCCVFGFFLSSSCVLCTLYCHFLWIVHFYCPFGIL